MITCVEFAAAIHFELTKGQCVFVKVAIDGVPFDDLSEDDRAIAVEMFGAIESIPAAARRAVLAIFGRGAGKTELAALVGLYLCFVVDVSKCGPGDTPCVIVVSPDVDTSRIFLDRAIARVMGSALRSRLVGEPTKTSFTLRRDDGRHVRFEVRAASRGGARIRGRSIVCLVLDELAQFYGDGFVVNDAEIVRAARPRILPGGMVFGITTPWLQEGWTWTTFSANHGKPTTAIVALASSMLVRDNDPQILADFAAERATDSDNAAREYLCEWVASGSTRFFDDETLTVAVNDNDFVECDAKAAGGDLALLRDCSALAIVGSKQIDGATSIRPIEFQEYTPKKGQPLKLSDVVASFVECLKRHKLDSFIADNHVREQARSFAETHDVTIECAPTGRDGKWETYAKTKRLLAEGRLSLPNDARLLAQLRGIRSKPMPGGGYKITSQRRVGSGHGDLVSALVLAVAAINENSEEDRAYGAGSRRW